MKIMLKLVLLALQVLKEIRLGWDLLAHEVLLAQRVLKVM
jgi:hypothetical protein